MSKHPYDDACTCAKCAREASRRTVQGRRAIVLEQRPLVRRIRSRKPAWVTDRDSYPRESRRPAAGSQEWAETRADDLGPSGDY